MNSPLSEELDPIRDDKTQVSLSFRNCCLGLEALMIVAMSAWLNASALAGAAAIQQHLANTVHAYTRDLDRAHSNALAAQSLLPDIQNTDLLRLHQVRSKRVVWTQRRELVKANPRKPAFTDRNLPVTRCERPRDVVPRHVSIESGVVRLHHSTERFSNAKAPFSALLGVCKFLITSNSSLRCLRSKYALASRLVDWPSPKHRLAQHMNMSAT
jgi:hypothetical protein